MASGWQFSGKRRSHAAPFRFQVCPKTQNQLYYTVAQTFLGVGVGEAGGVAPAYSLISDYFTPGHRARAMSVYSFGIPIGSAIGVVFGGVIASLINWRYAFFIVGMAGIWAGGWLGDRFGQNNRSNYARIPAFAFIATVPFYVLAILSPNLPLTFLVLLVPTALGLAWLGPVISAIQHLVRPDMRATASAIFLFINNLIGIGLGTYAIGALSDVLQVRFGEESLRYSILSGTGFYIVAAVLLLLAARWLEQDWED